MPAAWSNSKTPLLKTFPSVFWVANVMELFERAAYYGLNSVLAIYLIESGGEGRPRLPRAVRRVPAEPDLCLQLRRADRSAARSRTGTATGGCSSSRSRCSRPDTSPPGNVTSYGVGLRGPPPHGDGRRPLQADHLGHDRALDERRELGLRLRHLLLDDQRRRVPRPARRQRPQGLLLALGLHGLVGLLRAHVPAGDLRLQGAAAAGEHEELRRRRRAAPRSSSATRASCS